MLVWAVIVLGVLLPMLKRPSIGAAPRSTPPTALPDELVKDPVCQTYVLRSRAVRRDAAEGPRYFCSTECARRDAGRV